VSSPSTISAARGEQWIKEGKGAIKWTRLSCRSFAANDVRLHFHALAYNLGNFLRTQPEPIKDWSLTSLKEKLIKIDAKVVSQGRYVIFRMAEVAIESNVQRDFPAHRAAAATTSASARRSMYCIHEQPTEGVRPNARETGQVRSSTKLSGYPKVLVGGRHFGSVLQEDREREH
jgi:hypothetical protein